MKKTYLIVKYYLLLILSILIVIPSIFLNVHAAQPNNDSSLNGIKDLLNIIFSNSPLPTSAPTPATSGPVTPPPLPPGLGGVSSAYDAVTTLVSNIQNYCGGVVNQANQSCLNNFGPPTDVTVEILRAAANSNYLDYQLSCVTFAKAIGRMVDRNDWGTPGDAKNLLTSSLITSGKYQAVTNCYSSNASPGCVTQPMQPGDYPIWNYDTFGHVGYALVVYGTDSFLVAEGNFHNRGDAQDTRIDFLSDSNLVGWLHKL